jgi:hypothetical protein
MQAGRFVYFWLPKTKHHDEPCPVSAFLSPFSRFSYLADDEISLF